jgi:hypothetical protein
MKKLFPVLVAILILSIALTATNCGRKKTAEKEEPGLFQQAKNVAKGIQAVSKTVEAAKKDEERKPVDPVNFRELLPLLPQPINGWQANEKPSGSTQSYGQEWKFTEVAQSYTKDNSRIAIKITDGAYIPMLYTAFTFASSLEEDTTERYHKGITVGEDKGFEEYNYNNKDGKIVLLVNKRFILEISGSTIEKADILHDYLNQLDTKKLAALAK